MVAESKIKGDIATTKVIADLTVKGYDIFIPVVCEHLHFDLIAHKDNICIRIQSKYSSNGFIPTKTVWNDKHGSHTRKYSLEDFDYYAIYLSKIDKICYPHISLGGITINQEEPSKYSFTPYYWYEEFLNLTDYVEKRIPINPKSKTGKTEKSINSFKGREIIDWPDAENLQQMLFELPMSKLAINLGVSDKAIAKRVKKLNLKLPPTGFWTTKNFTNKV